MPAIFQVGVKVLLENEEGKYLLILSHDRGWEIPGGAVEKGENLLAALHREVREEIDVEICGEKLAGIYTNHLEPERLLVWFRARIRSGTPSCSDEVKDLLWCGAEEVLDKVEHPAFRDRLIDLFHSDGRIRYRAFRSTPYLKDLTYLIEHEAWI